MSSPSPIPPLDTSPAPRPSRRGLPAGWGPYLAVNAMLVVVWASTGAGYFWPIWPILGWGVGLLAGCGRGGGCGATRARRSSHPRVSEPSGPQDAVRH